MCVHVCRGRGSGLCGVVVVVGGQRIACSTYCDVDVFFWWHSGYLSCRVYLWFRRGGEWRQNLLE